MGTLVVYEGLAQVASDPRYTVAFKQPAGIDDAYGAILDEWARRMLGVARETKEVGYGPQRRFVTETDDAFRARMRQMLISQWRVLADRDFLGSPLGEGAFPQMRERQKNMTEAQILAEVAKCRPVLNVRIENAHAVGWRRTRTRAASPEEVQAALEGTLPGGVAIDPRGTEGGPTASIVEVIGPRQWIGECLKRGVDPYRVISLLRGWSEVPLSTERWEHGLEWAQVRAAAQAYRDLAQGGSAKAHLERLADFRTCPLCGDLFTPRDRLQPFTFCLGCGGDLYSVGESLTKAEQKYAKARGISLDEEKATSP